MRAIINIFQLARVSKFSKGFWLFFQVADLGLSGYVLGDEIYKSLAGDNYDGELKGLCDKVAELGVQYDKLLAEISDFNNAIENAIASQQNILHLVLDYERKQKLMGELEKKLSTLEKELTKKIPTKYFFFSEEFIKLKTNDLKLNQQTLIKNVQDTHRPLPTWMLSVSGTLFGFMTIYIIYQVFRRYKPEDPRPSSSGDIRRGTYSPEIELLPQQLQLRERSKSVGDVPSVESVENFPAHQKPTTKSKKSVSSRLIFYGVTFLKVSSVIVTLGSFGMSVYSLVQQNKTRNQCVQELNTLINRYQKEIPLYNFFLNGCKNEKGDTNDSIVEEVINLIYEKKEDKDVDETTKEIIADGAKKVWHDHILDINVFVDKVKDVYDELEKIHNSILEKDNKFIGELGELGKAREDLNKSQSFNEMASKLKKGKEDFTELRSQYKNLSDSPKNSDEKRKNLIDKIVDNFTENINKPLNALISDISEVYDYHLAIKQLISFAQGLINEAVEDEKKNIKRTKIEAYAKMVLKVINADREKENSRKITEEQIVKFLIHLINSDANDTMAEIPIVTNKISGSDDGK
jgi:hypothetical protein